MSQFIHTLEGMTCRMVEDGEADETIDEMAIPELYADWLFASFFSDNMHFLYQRWLREQGDKVEPRNG
jgi:hypothetical protein